VTSLVSQLYASCRFREHDDDARYHDGGEEPEKVQMDPPRKRQNSATES